MLKTFCYRIFCGFFLGLSVFAPGFSGSVIAVIMGIYQDLVRILSNPFKQLKQNLLFLLPLLIGAACSAVLFVISFKFLFETYEKATYLLIVGLIAGNLPVIVKTVKKFMFQRRYLIGGTGAFAVAVALGVFAMGVGEATGAAGLQVSLPFLALSGFLAGVMALIPGMSFTMILIVMGVYGQLIVAAETLLHMNFTYLVHFGLFGLSVAAGMVLASRGIKTVFDKIPGFANSAVLGFMAGSMAGILIQGLQMPDVNFDWLLGGVMLAVGLGVSVLFVVLGKALNKS